MHESLHCEKLINLFDNELSCNKNGLKEYGGLRLMEKDICKYRIMKGNPQIKSEVGRVRPLSKIIIVNTSLPDFLPRDPLHQFDECQDCQ
jgi:hypothetical protein